MTEKINLVIYQGDSYSKKLTFTDNGDPIDLSAFTIESQMRRAFASPDAVDFTIDDTDSNVGEVVISLSHGETTKLVSGDYVWDIQRADVTVTPGGVEATFNEVQAIDLGGSETGTWTITFDGEETSALDWDASADDVKSALEALSNIASGDVAVDIDMEDNIIYVVTFLGNLAGSDQPTMEIDDSDLESDATVEVRQQGGDVFYPDDVEYSDVLTLAFGKVTVVPEVTR